MRVLVVCLGNIGKRHLKNLISIKSDIQITVWRLKHKPESGSDYPLGQVRFVESLEDAINPMPDAALITCPASEHISTALSLAERGIHIFIEKPLSHNLDGIDELISLVNRKHLTAMVGYTLRFSGPLNALKQAVDQRTIGKILGFRAEVGQYLPDWRVGSDYTKSASAQTSLGGGAVLELSHELDYTRWLFGDVASVQGVTAKLSDLTIDVEDTAEIILNYKKGGVIGSIHLDMLQKTPVRYCRIFGSMGTLVMNFIDNSVKVHTTEAHNGIYIFGPCEIDRNDMYVDEINHFFDCIETGSKPLIDIYDGKKVMQIADAIKKSSREQKVVSM